MSLNLKVLALLNRQYAPTSQVELTEGDLKLEIQTDSFGCPQSVLLYLIDRAPSSGVVYIKEQVLGRLNEEPRFNWQKKLDEVTV